MSLEHLETHLKRAVETCRDGISCALLDGEGFAVACWPAQDEDTARLVELGLDFASFLQSITTTASDGTEFDELALVGGARRISALKLPGGYVLMLLAGAEGISGQGRFVLRKCASSISPFLLREL